MTYKIMKTAHPAQKVLMVRPKSFRSNEETSSSNAFQQEAASVKNDTVLKDAQSEFDAFAHQLIQNGVDVKIFQEPDGVDTPDCLFPNNWFAHLPDGRIFLFPMLAPNRRREVQVEWLASVLGRQQIFDLRNLAAHDVFLEGTGSLILDHKNRTGYACLSSRTHPVALEEFEKQSGYSIFSFQANDKNDVPFYHTNVMMALGEDTAVVCLESLPLHHERMGLVTRLENSGRSLIEITQHQVTKFAGNMIQLKSGSDQLLWVCSQQAYNSLSDLQKTRLEKNSKMISSPLTTIERFGGGSARCMLAELF